MLKFGFATHSRRLISRCGITDNNERADGNLSLPSRELVYIRQVVVEVQGSVSGIINGHCDIT
jgi:hypothetical protein